MHLKSPEDAGLGRLAIAVELIHSIFSEIEGIHDVACLCISNKTLWAIGYQYVLKIMKANPARWDGDRIIRIGVYTEDLPEWLLSAVESDELGETAQKLDGQDSSNNEGSDIDLYDIASQNWSCDSNIWRPLRGDSYRGRKMAGYELKLYRNLIKPHCVYDGRWVLCNLSKLQYVRADIVMAKGNALHLGDIALFQIGWSTGSYIGPQYEGSLHDGAWAGDRFHITIMDVVNGSLRKMGEWQDVTRDLIERVVGMWRAVYGPEWPEAKD